MTRKGASVNPQPWYPGMIVDELRAARERIQELENVLLPMTRGVCLQQRIGDKCICYTCKAREVMA